jgi:hypothetical protein
MDSFDNSNWEHTYKERIKVIKVRKFAFSQSNTETVYLKSNPVV